MQSALRLFHIYRVAARYRLSGLLQGLPRARLAAALLNLAPAHPDIAQLDRGNRVRLALEELGPIFIKFGQLLSTRRDLVPEDIADALALLQDRVAPFDGEQAQALVERALGGPIAQHFAHFETTPLASASVAQVHPAMLHDGASVVVKVLRPGIDKIIASDLALMHHVASVIEARVPGSRRLRLREVVRDYEYVIRDELNLLNEAANTSQLRRNFENSPQLYVPRIHWEYCRENIMVAERIHGIPVNQVDELRAAGIDIRRLAEIGVEIFFTQVFKHSFFHADMHPGNVFVSREHQANPQYIALDCAIIGSLSKDDQQYLARNLLAIFKRDYRRVAELHVECGWVPLDTPLHAFEATMRAVCEPIFQKPLGEISFGQLLLQLFRTASRFNMQVQPSLVLLQKTMLNIEGLGKQLYPELDLWQTALPFLERWQHERLSPLKTLKQVRERLPEWIEQSPELPDLILSTLREGSTARIALAALAMRTQELERRARRFETLSLAFAAALGALLLVILLH